MRKPSLTTEQTKELRELFDSGKNINQLSAYFRVSDVTIKNYLSKSEHKHEDLEGKKQEPLINYNSYSLEQKYDTLGRLYIELLVTKEIDKLTSKKSVSSFKVDPYA